MMTEDIKVFTGSANPAQQVMEAHNQEQALDSKMNLKNYPKLLKKSFKPNI